jgi:predicted DNA-binding protein YlxM (UPF0122 family)
LTDKQRIVEKFVAGSSYGEIASEYGVSRQAIGGIVKLKDAINKAVDEGAGVNRKTLKTASAPEMDAALLQWLKQARSQSVAVNGPLLMVGVVVCLASIRELVNKKEKSCRKRPTSWLACSGTRTSSARRAGWIASSRGTA